jgi:hypothetical protein
MSNDENSYGLLIPIVVLLIVMYGIGEPWLLVPIGILSLIFIANLFENQRIRSRRQTSEPVAEDIKPIYDQKKRKDEGVTCGSFIPIIILGWLYVQTRSWPFLIPLFVLTIVLIGTLYDQIRGKTEVREELDKEVHSISDISDRTGLPEEKVRRHIVTEKRKGTTDIWFDASSGEITSAPIQDAKESTERKVGCAYCGFALKPHDRFCPFCGAPIRA